MGLAASEDLAEIIRDQTAGVFSGSGADILFVRHYRRDGDGLVPLTLAGESDEPVDARRMS